jgi:hypothetical protein
MDEMAEEFGEMLRVRLALSSLVEGVSFTILDSVF